MCELPGRWVRWDTDRWIDKFASFKVEISLVSHIVNRFWIHHLLLIVIDKLIDLFIVVFIALFVHLSRIIDITVSR